MWLSLRMLKVMMMHGHFSARLISLLHENEVVGNYGYSKKWLHVNNIDIKWQKNEARCS